MKSTGIIRRIDSLGRIVIPKEIRKSLKIFENDMLEISLDNNVIKLQKTSTFSDSLNNYEEIFKLVNKLYSCDVFVSDKSKILLYVGKDKMKYVGKNISNFLHQCLNTRQKLYKNEKSILQIINELSNPETVNNYLIIPIISSGDIYGTLGFINYNSFENIINIGNIIEKILHFELKEI